MSDEPILRLRSRSSSGSGRALRLPLLILSAGMWVFALSEIGQSWEMVRLASGYEPPSARRRPDQRDPGDRSGVLRHA